ncbi:MAG: nucleoside deaminase [Ignavibacteriales bacterium]
MQDFLKKACLEAKHGIDGGHGGPFGAVVVKDGTVIASGHNMVLASKDSTAHGEIVAIRKAEQILGTHDLSGCELYTTCYPCPMCLGAIMWARISRVIYGSLPAMAAKVGFDDEAFYQAMADPDNNKIVTMEYRASQECAALFEQWLNSDKHELY